MDEARARGKQQGTQNKNVYQTNIKGIEKKEWLQAFLKKTLKDIDESQDLKPYPLESGSGLGRTLIQSLDRTLIHLIKTRLEPDLQKNSLPFLFQKNETS